MNTPKSNEGAIYKAKQEWLERVMSSDFAPATKIFAWGVFQRMYGVKLVSNPGSNTIYEDTRIGKSKHADHRKKLSGCGAMAMRLIKSDKGDWASYEYQLNLNWDGNTALLLEAGCTPQGITSGPDITSEEEGSYPQGTTLPPTGYDPGTQKVGQVLPTGSTNTTINTPTKTSSNTTNKEDAGLRPAVEEVELPRSKRDEENAVVVDSSLSEVSKTPASLDIEKEKAAAVDVEKKNAPPAFMKQALESAREVNAEIASILDTAAVPEKAWEFYNSPVFRAEETDKRKRAVWAQLESQDYVVRNWNDSDDLEDPDVEW